MKKNVCFPLAITIFFSFFCFSGQSPRQEIQEISVAEESRSVLEESEEHFVEKEQQSIGKERKSAAQKAIEAHDPNYTSTPSIGAAKKAVKAEQDTY